MDSDGNEGRLRVKKPRHRNCLFNIEWISDAKCSGWLCEQDDLNTAYCTLCKSVINIKYDGIKALNRHNDTKKHCDMANVKKMSNTMSKFFGKKM